jgi:hypothetical protein
MLLKNRSTIVRKLKSKGKKSIGEERKDLKSKTLLKKEARSSNFHIKVYRTITRSDSEGSKRGGGRLGEKSPKNKWAMLAKHAHKKPLSSAESPYPTAEENKEDNQFTLFKGREITEAEPLPQIVFPKIERRSKFRPHPKNHNSSGVAKDPSPTGATFRSSEALKLIEQRRTSVNSINKGDLRHKLIRFQKNDITKKRRKTSFNPQIFNALKADILNTEDGIHQTEATPKLQITDISIPLATRESLKPPTIRRATRNSILAVSTYGEDSENALKKIEELKTIFRKESEQEKEHKEKEHKEKEEQEKERENQKEKEISKEESEEHKLEDENSGSRRKIPSPKISLTKVGSPKRPSPIYIPPKSRKKRGSVAVFNTQPACVLNKSATKIETPTSPFINSKSYSGFLPKIAAPLKHSLESGGGVLAISNSEKSLMDLPTIKEVASPRTENDLVMHKKSVIPFEKKRKSVTRAIKLRKKSRRSKKHRIQKSDNFELSSRDLSSPISHSSRSSSSSEDAENNRVNQSIQTSMCFGKLRDMAIQTSIQNLPIFPKVEFGLATNIKASRNYLDENTDNFLESMIKTSKSTSPQDSLANSENEHKPIVASKFKALVEFEGQEKVIRNPVFLIKEKQKAKMEKMKQEKRKPDSPPHAAPAKNVKSIHHRKCLLLLPSSLRQKYLKIRNQTTKLNFL